MIAVEDGYDNQHQRLFHHERCNRAAREVEIEGLLTSARAVLCEQHEDAARRQAYASKSGYPLKKTRAYGPRSKKDDEPFLPFRVRK